MTDIALQNYAMRTCSIKQDTNLLQVTQLLEERTFTDGEVERDYAQTVINFSSEEAEELLRVAKSPLSQSKYDNYVSGYSVYVTFYYTIRFTEPYTYRVDRIGTTIVKNYSTSKTVTSGSQMYRFYLGPVVWESFSYSNSSGLSAQMFTLYSRHSGFYVSCPDAWGAIEEGIFIQSVVNFSSGECVIIQFTPDS